MPATVPSFQDHFISVARPCPRHQVESLERDRLPAALAPPVLLRSLVQPLERGVDLGKLRRLARGVHDACSLLEQASLQVLPLCRGQRHTPSPWEIAARRSSRKHRDAVDEHLMVRRPFTAPLPQSFEPPSTRTVSPVIHRASSEANCPTCRSRSRANIRRTSLTRS